MVYLANILPTLITIIATMTVHPNILKKVKYITTRQAKARMPRCLLSAKNKVCDIIRRVIDPIAAPRASKFVVQTILEKVGPLYTERFIQNEIRKYIKRKRHAVNSNTKNYWSKCVNVRCGMYVNPKKLHLGENSNVADIDLALRKANQGMALKNTRVLVLTPLSEFDDRCLASLIRVLERHHAIYTTATVDRTTGFHNF